MSPAKFVGIDNWRRAFADPLIQTTIRNTIVYSMMAIPAVFVIAMVLALALNAVRRGQNLFKTIIYLPTLQPMLIVALMFTFVLHQDFGILNIVLRSAIGGTGQFSRRCKPCIADNSHG